MTLLLALSIVDLAEAMSMRSPCEDKTQVALVGALLVHPVYAATGASCRLWR